MFHVEHTPGEVSRFDPSPHTLPNTQGPRLFHVEHQRSITLVRRRTEEPRDSPRPHGPCAPPAIPPQPQGQARRPASISLKLGYGLPERAPSGTHSPEPALFPSASRPVLPAARQPSANAHHSVDPVATVTAESLRHSQSGSPGPPGHLVYRRLPLHDRGAGRLASTLTYGRPNGPVELEGSRIAVAARRPPRLPASHV